MSSVEPSVSLPGEVIRQLAPPSLACRMACGQLCRHEQRNFSNIEKKSIFDSLSANWVHTGELVAMARPSEDYLPILIPEMKSRGVNTVVNVQELNEHQYCGEIHRSGFTYLPETFMKHQITFYNFPTPDFGCWESHIMLQILKVLEFAATEGAIGVHCHAGLGRTGVICAGYLIFVKGLTSEEAKMIVRRNRPGSLQTRSQLQAVDDFEIYLSHRRKWPDQESLYELWKLQRPTTTKRNRMRKKYDICVPHFLDYCHEIATNQDFDQPNVFDLEDWLFKDRVKNGFWPHIKTMSKTEFGRVVLDWLTSLKEALISGSGSIEYIPVLNSHSAVTSARLAVEILRILSIPDTKIIHALTHNATSDEKLIKWIFENDPTHESSN